MSTKTHWKDKKILLSLIVIASHMNSLGKLGNQIRYLTPNEQKYVINNITPEGVDISKLTESINNFKQNKLTLDFIHGLFDGDGNITVFFTSKKSTSSESNQCYVGFNFTIVQDKQNLTLLNEIQMYFNDKGRIYNISKECKIYQVRSKSDLISVILPKMVNKKSMEFIKDSTIEQLKLPLLKYNKIFYISKILEICPVGFKNNKEIMNKIIRLSYNVIKDSDNITLEEYIKKINQK